MVTLFQHACTLAGRALLSAVFLVSGVSHVFHWRQTIAYMEQKGVPVPNLLLLLAVVCLLLGGLSVLVGARARSGAILLILFLVPTTIVFHNFWAVPSAEVPNEMYHFLKNLGLIGGLLMVLAFGAGGFSIDLFFRVKKIARHQ